MIEQRFTVQIGTQTCEGVVEIEYACPHPELTTMESTNLGYCEYQCVACGKKIAVPMYQFYSNIRDSRENLAGIIGLAFGDRWEKLVREGGIV